MAGLRNRKRVPGGRTGSPVSQGHALRRVLLSCGHVQRDRLAHRGDHVWCEGECSDWMRVVSVEE